MSDRFKYKVNGVKTPIEALPLEAPIIDPKVFLTLAEEEKIVINTILNNPNSFKTTIQINDKDVVVYATPGCSITVPGKEQPTVLLPLDTNPIQNTGRIFDETHPVLYLVHSDVTVEDVTKRSIFGWVKLDILATRDSSVINTPVALGTETYGTTPRYSSKAGYLNECLIVDTEFHKVDHVLGSNIERSVIKAPGDINRSIIDDLNLTAKSIDIDRSFITSCAFHVKSFTARANAMYRFLTLSNHNFFGKNATLKLTTPLDIFKVEVGLFSVLFATTDKSDCESPEFFAFSGHYGDDEKLSMVKTDNLGPYLDQLKAEILSQNEIYHPGVTIDPGSLDSVLMMVLNTLTSRANVYRLTNQ